MTRLGDVSGAPRAQSRDHINDLQFSDAANVLEASQQR
jgi:hypothetical protein